MKKIGFTTLMIRNVVITIIVPVTILLIFFGLMKIPFLMGQDGMPVNPLARLVVAFSMMGLMVGYALYAIPAAILFPYLFKINFKLPIPEPENMYGWISILITYLLVSAMWAFVEHRKRKKGCEPEVGADLT